MSDVETAKQYFAELNRAFAGDGDIRYAQLFSMRDGRFVRARMYANKEKAIAAAKLAQ
jgi:hypothetical protein